ncbi:carbohydrate-binding protein [Clostridium sp. MCC353]|uniref:carbohydrate-binding protein n=1 Tax=Clostridium sp. MCC353 TaxID=2592646 RepID=UPI00207A3D5F|nr:carbohydrate-binding protein [Clostridium sp. MCC353]
MLKLSILDKDNAVKFQVEDNEHIIAVYEAEYENGDHIVLETEDINAYYVVRIDDTMDEAFVYVTKPQVDYVIPFEEKRVSYNPKSFTGDKHYLTFRLAKEFEIKAYKNLAKNVMDQHGDTGCFPHAYANVETRGEAVFAARNAIDGVLANESHGKWPYESWGINKQDDAEITLDFGRKVDFDKILLYTRADFPHDNWWVKATLTFSDGTREVVEMVKSVKPHEFCIEKKGIEWIKVSELIKADDPSPFPALSQIEVYGVEG